jgi:hypothetical protein
MRSFQLLQNYLLYIHEVEGELGGMHDIIDWWSYPAMYQWHLKRYGT